jgi:hypothetical protein
MVVLDWGKVKEEGRGETRNFSGPSDLIGTLG